MSKWIIMASLAALWLFAAGLLTGRELPAHHFERFGTTGYLFDASTGHLCNAFAYQSESAATPPPGFEIVKPNAIDQALTGQKDANGFPIVKDTSGLGSAWTSPNENKVPSCTPH